MPVAEGNNNASTYVAPVRTARLLSAGLVVTAASGITLVGGCADSFMDPSVSGRWEQTPTVMPILSRLASIEDESGDLVEYSDPVPEDLIPLATTYRLGPGDQLEVTLFDLIVQNQPETYEVTLDARGYVELPQLGRIPVAGKTTEQATEAIKDAMRRLVADPLVLVVARAQRQQTFNIVGAVESPGPYFIPKADYRLLEAITAGGGFSEDIPEIYVIRQVTLTDEMTGSAPAPSPTTPPGQTPAPTDNLIDIIDELAPQRPTQPEPAPPPSEPPAPAAPQTKPAEPPPPPIPLPGGAQPGIMGNVGERRAQPAKKVEDQPPPAIDLPEGNAPATPRRAERSESGSAWVFLNGKWVQVSSTRGATGAPGEDSAGLEMITQRVIRIPLAPLLAGRQSYNIVIRPGDVVRVPAPPSGLVYINGQVTRPGPYQIPTSGGLTLLRAIGSAGGYSALAIPWRVDVTRMIGNDRQATIRLDGRAIAEQTQPDLFLKPNDMVNVGTNFWAFPLWIIRGGFRASYGYGFILDRNLANDFFGPPPVNQIGQ